MRVKGLNLNIDGNYILNRVVYALKKTSTIHGDMEEAYINYINSHISSYPFENIYLVSDNKGSWRKEIYPEYKMNRKDKKDDDEIDWEFVFNTYNLIKEKLSSKVTVLDKPKIEGDDWIRYNIENSNRNGYSVLTLSSDQDLLQLLKYNTYSGYINMQYRDDIKPKLYMPDNYNMYLSELEESENDLFDLNSNYEKLEYINSLIVKTTVDEINPEKLLFVKLLSGDSGDNIKSVIQVPQKKDPSKMSGLGEKGAENIYTLYKENYTEDIDFKSDKFIEQVTPFIIDNKKVWGEKSEYTENIREKLELNKRLIILDDEYIPEHIKINLNYE